jgi:fermentation-respiration switch protein FrsA (DUF1100 family)
VSAVLRAIGILAAGLVLLLGLIWYFQRRLIYFPQDSDTPPAGAVIAGAEEISFGTADGLTLRGWFVPARGAASGATVLIFNGNAGNRAARAPLAKALSDRGHAVMLFDYRGFGGNPGRPAEKGLSADARGARVWLERRHDVDPGRIVLFGESLGAAVALASAVEQMPAGLVLRSPFTSMTDVGRQHYTWLPVGWLLADRYPSLQRVPGLRCPLLVFAGERDRIVPAAQSRALFDAAPAGRKRFVALAGGHNDLELLAGEDLIRETDEFIRQAIDTEEP